MKNKDSGTVHKVFVLILLTWTVLGWCVLLNLMKAGYMEQYVEDCLLQANLAAILADPYHYGSTGELVFEDVQTVKDIFEEVLQDSLGSADTRKRLGIGEPVLIQEFRAYEVTKANITEFIYDSQGVWKTKQYDHSLVVTSPDGTVIEESSLYARIEVPIAFMFGIELKAVKEHCVDIKSEVEDEQK